MCSKYLVCVHKIESEMSLSEIILSRENDITKLLIFIRRRSDRPKVYLNMGPQMTTKLQYRSASPLQHI